MGIKILGGTIIFIRDMKFTLLESLKSVIKEQTGSVEFTFKSMKPWKREGERPTWFVYFNDLEIVDGEYNKYENSIIYLSGDGEEYTVDPKYFDYYQKDNKGRVLLNVLKKENPKVVDKLFGGTGQITSKLIRQALEIAFKENWLPADDIYSPGLRGINTMGERMGNDESWSIMNFFDTKREVQNKIEQKWKKEGNGDILYWLADVFKNDKDFVNELLDIQWGSISNGYKTELYVSDKLSKAIGGKSQFFPPGSKMDRYKSIDMIINGKSYQVKPSSSVKKEGDFYKIKTYGMTNDYKNKSIDFIVYGNSDGKIYVFPNKNYDVKNHTEVEHYEEPQLF